MPLLSLTDLEYAFFGQSPDLASAQYAFYLAAYQAGASAANIMTRGTELGYTESTTLSFATTTTLADVTGMAVTVTVGTRPIIIEAYIPVSTVNAGGRSRLAILESSTPLNLADTSQINASGTSGTINARARLGGASQPSAGSHTYKLQGAVVTATAGTLAAGATFPMFIRVVEC